MAKYDEYRPRLKGSLKSEFSQANPEYWNLLQQRPRDIELARIVIGKAQEVERTLDQTYQATEQARISNHAIAVWEERSSLLSQVEKSAGQYMMSDTSILEEARKRAAHEQEQMRQQIFATRDKDIETIARGDHLIGHTATPQEIETMTDKEKDTHFKAEIHAAIDNAKKARIQASKLFNNPETRNDLIDKARENGSQHPEKDIQNLYRHALNDVDKQHHQEVHAVFEKYGFEYDKKDVEFYTRPEPADFDQSVADQDIRVIDPDIDIEIDEDQ